MLPHPRAPARPRPPVLPRLPPQAARKVCLASALSPQDSAETSTLYIPTGGAALHKLPRTAALQPKAAVSVKVSAVADQEMAEDPEGQADPEEGDQVDPAGEAMADPEVEEEAMAAQAPAAARARSSTR